MDLLARQPLLPGPDLVAYRDQREVDLWARQPFAAGPSLVAYPAGRVVPFSAGPPPAGISANLSATLENATLSSTATVLVTAALTATLESATLSSTATVLVTAALNATLADATLSSSATVLVTAALTVALEDATLSSTATVLVTAALSAVLEAATLASSATVTGGAVASTLSGRVVWVQRQAAPSLFAPVLRSRVRQEQQAKTVTKWVPDNMATVLVAPRSSAPVRYVGHVGTVAVVFVPRVEAIVKAVPR